MGIWKDFGVLLLLAFAGLLIFGKRLPEVGRSLGKGIVEFKKGLAGIDEDVNRATTPAAAPPATLPPAATEPRQLAAPLPPAAPAATDPQIQEQLRATQEQIRQLSEQLRATREELAHAKKS